MAPPQLTRDAPIPYVRHPILVDFRPSVRGEPDETILNCFERWHGERLHFHEPLVGKVRLDHGVTTVAFPDVVGIGLDFFQQAFGFKIGDDARARVIAIEIPVWLRNSVRRPGRDIKNRDLFEIVPLPNPIIVRIMGRRYLDGAGPETRVNKIIRDNWNCPVSERELGLHSLQMAVPWVFRIDRNRSVSEHCFGAGRGDREEF